MCNEMLTSWIVDMSKPVYRYMRQKQFEKEPKSKLMERLTQMNVIPDLIAPGLNPTVQVNINLPEGSIEPGVFIKPEQVKGSLIDFFFKKKLMLYV